MRATLLSLLAIAAAAQDQTGRIEGVVLDAISHQPVKKAAVSVNFMGSTRGQTQVQNGQAAITDASGTFAFNGLPAGRYQLTVMHQSYPRRARAVSIRMCRYPRARLPPASPWNWSQARLLAVAS
jgi:uncharacterized protein (DUF2141 family)